MAAALDDAVDEIADASSTTPRRPEEQRAVRPVWPMIVLRTPKGWTGPKEVDGLPTEGSFRSHQVPLSELAEKPEHLQLLETWLRCYRPEELFDEEGAVLPELAELAPSGRSAYEREPARERRACCFATSSCPTSATTPSKSTRRPRRSSEATRVLGRFLRDVMRLNEETGTSGSFGPDETASNRLGAVFEVDDRELEREHLATDDHLSPDGRVMEVLSEHMCQGWLEGYLLTGRHGLFNCYEAFIHIVDSMFNQHAKWLKVTRRIPWRRPIASSQLPAVQSRLAPGSQRVLSPGSRVHRPRVNKKAEIIRVYLPPDANTLLSVADHCLRSRNYVNVIVAGKQPALNYLSMDEAIAHCTRGIGIWEWACNDSMSGTGEPDVVMACAGDVPTLETLAATALLREYLPNLSRARCQRRRPDASAAGHRASARHVRRRVRRAVHDRQAGRDLRLPRLSVADPPADLSADQPRTTSTCAGTRRRARRPRRSTW